MSKLDQFSQWIEQPVRKTTISNRLNPLPHAGTISVFLLGVVVVTGLYITLFFEFGYEASYNSVVGLEKHPIQKVMRALHRYSSAALVVTTVVHAWRIFASGRFVGRRRFWRWSTGLAALILVWLAGVTGYWLIWDIRAQAISESVATLIRWTSWGARISVGHLLPSASSGPGSGSGSGSGSSILVAIWFAHVLLTMVIGWFTFRHLRRTQLSFIPPRHWIIMMGATLTVLSVAWPVGMLAPANPSQIPGDMPLDPFMMFLLPPLLSQWRWVALAIFATVIGIVWFVPRVISRNTPSGPVAVDAETCTGCELCVVDCPYLALTMVDLSEPSGQRQNQIAHVDPQSCVGCGICLGSCAFGSLSIDGIPKLTPVDVSGQRVVIACDRHAERLDDLLQSNKSETKDGDIEPPMIFPVRCAGMFNAKAVSDFIRSGASEVQMLGCPPADCRYGTGNLIASERLQGKRAPHLPRRFVGMVAEDWVSPATADGALQRPGTHTAASADVLPSGGKRTLVGAVLVVSLSVVGIGLATQAPFSPTSNDAELRVIVDHDPGATLEFHDQATGSAGVPVKLEATSDGTVLLARQIGDGNRRTTTYVDIPLEPGRQTLTVSVVEGTDRSLILDQTLDVQHGQRVFVSAIDASEQTPADQGRELFFSSKAACNICHSVEPGVDGVGPSLAGIGTTAATRVDGLGAEHYLRQSILLPDQYVVDGYRPGQMLPIYRDQLDEQEREAIIAYLLSLTSD